MKNIYLDFDRTTPISVLDLFTITYSNKPAWLKRSENVHKIAKEA